ncbi:MAG: helicase-related protein [Myxococcota bacterium]|nr:helicase-related protein [Myxococcota bacterium]
MSKISEAVMQSGGGTLLRALLGPTNTGKTHRAIERLIAYGSGMMGFPLRLLAREIYDRLCKEVGDQKVALITGEERLEPEEAVFWICTVESMPSHRAVPFVVIDEIQLATHPKRGHIFTDRMLNLRGTRETWFLGSDSMLTLIERLFPVAEIEILSRFSKLSYTSPKRLESLPKRTAIIAFSAAELYSLADAIRRIHGGVAVVLGGLSPKARNAQVQLFESGEVDYLVSTDAIGMGLNLELRYVFFDSLRKFDGKEYRDLLPWELGQIAGRAGRFRKEGFFGLTASAANQMSLSPDVIEAIEQQSFRPFFRIWYRNSSLDFSSMALLKESLQKSGFSKALVPSRMMEDECALHALSSISDVKQLTESGIRLLWDVCRIPDYRQEGTERHLRFLVKVFRQLRQGFIHESWIEHSLRRLSNVNADIEGLMRMLSDIRTWSYIAHRSEWIEHPVSLQSRTKELEEAISSSLHRRLSERFIDYRAKKSTPIDLPREIRIQGDELHCAQCKIGELKNFSFVSSVRSNQRFGLKKSHALGRQAFRDKAQQEFQNIVEDGIFSWAEGNRILANGVGIAYLSKGKTITQPNIHPFGMDLLLPKQKNELLVLAQRWLKQQISTLYITNKNKRYKGLIYLLQEHLGVVQKQELPKTNTRLDGRSLKSLGIGQSSRYLYFRAFLKPRFQTLRLVLLSCWHKVSVSLTVPGNRVSLHLEWPDALGFQMGWLPVGGRWIRIDVYAKLERFLRKEIDKGPKEIPMQPTQWLGCKKEEWLGILTAMGYRIRDEGVYPPRRRGKR